MTTAPNSAILDPVTNPALTVAPQSKEDTTTVSYTHLTAKVVFTLNNAHLWDGVDDPFLYTVSAKLDNGEETSARFGCRKFEICLLYTSRCV